MKAEYDSNNKVTYITDKKTDPIKVQQNSVIGFNGQILRDSKNSYNVMTLPFINTIPPNSPFSQLDLQIERKIIINGVEKEIVPHEGEYKDDVYYFNSQGITFIEKNLTERINTIGFKIDGLTSNYISIKQD
jgi:hypothetical protein